MKRKILFILTLFALALLFNQCRSCGCTGYAPKANNKKHNVWYKK